MRITPLPLVAALAFSCVGGTATKSTGDSGATTFIPPMVPPTPTGATGDTGTTHIPPMPAPETGGSGSPVRSAPPGLSPLPDVEPIR